MAVPKTNLIDGGNREFSDLSLGGAGFRDCQLLADIVVKPAPTTMRSLGGGGFEFPYRELFELGTKKLIALIHSCILNQLNICSAVIVRGIISGTGTISLPSQNCGCWLGKNAKIDRSSGSISHPN